MKNIFRFNDVHNTTVVTGRTRQEIVSMLKILENKKSPVIEDFLPEQNKQLNNRE